MLQVGAGGRWSAFEAALVLPRQNGKGGLLEARQLYGLFLGGERLAVHTAHEFKTAYEHFLRIKTLVEMTPELDARVQRIRTGAGDQAIELKTGERLRFIARSSGSGRGLTGDTVYLDEAFALTSEIMGALLPTLSAVPNPQLIYTSSAPKFSQRILYELVQRGRSGGSDRLFYAEWGNTPDVLPHDREAWARANPALGIRIAEESIQAEWEASRSYPEEFLRERLGVVSEAEVSSVLDFGSWRSSVDPGSSAASGWPSLVVSAGMTSAAFGYVGVRDDGRLHVEAPRHEIGTGWVVDAARNATTSTGNPLVVDPKSPTGGLLDRLRAEGIPLLEVSTLQFVQGCAALQDDLLNDRLRHIDQTSLNAAVQGADVRPVGEAWAFSGRVSAVDISPLVAVTLAAIPVREARNDVFAGSFHDLNDFLDD